MSSTQHVQNARPEHPGGFLKRQVILPAGLSVTRAAEALGVTRVALSTVLNERSRLSPEMALRCEMAFGLPMETLMRMQNSYDIALAREHEHEIADEVVRIDLTKMVA